MRLWGYVFLAMVVSACATAPGPTPAAFPRPRGGPAPAGASPQAVWQAFLDAQPRQLKMRHQVETRFAGRHEVVDGVLLLELPDHFWVRALSPLGATLFDVGKIASHLQHEVYLPGLDARGPQFLARDIRRIFLRQCPSETPALARGDEVIVACPIGDLDPPIDTGMGIDPPDDHLEMAFTPGGILLRKQYSAGGTPTALVAYGYAPQGDTRWSTRTTLTHARIAYALDIQLVSVDPHFDVVKALRQLDDRAGSEDPAD